jgi:glycosyltransferase involved in cell wall biosynthesis
VASSNATCLPEVYGSAARYFDPENTADMVAAIKKVLTDKDERQGLIAAGQERTKQFHWRDTVAGTLAVYRSLLK